MNVLAIGAHFDDVELGCGGALIKHVAIGDSVTVYVVTLSGFTDHKKNTIRSNEIALKEGHQAMKVIGADLIRGAFNTFEVEFSEAITSQIIKIVEERRIGMVYTHWIGDIHHDHQMVARASLHSCRHVPRMLMYRSNWYHSTLEFKGNFYIDITDYWAKKEKAIRAHRTEMKRTGLQWIEFFRNEAANAGQRIGTKYAEIFEVVKWLW